MISAVQTPVLSTSLFDRIPEIAEAALLKVISLVNDIWASVSDCRLCFCGKTRVGTPKTELDTYLKKGSKIIDGQVKITPMEGLASSSIQMATVLTFNGEIVGVQCSRVNQHSTPALTAHGLKVMKDLRQSLETRKLNAWSSVRITTIVVGDCSSDKKRMEYKTADLVDQNSNHGLTTSGSCGEFPASDGPQLLDSILKDYTSTDPKNKKEKLNHFLFGKV